MGRSRRKRTLSASERADALCARLKPHIVEMIEKNDPAVDGLDFNQIEANSAAVGDLLAKASMRFGPRGPAPADRRGDRRGPTGGPEERRPRPRRGEKTRTAPHDAHAGQGKGDQDRARRDKIPAPLPPLPRPQGRDFSPSIDVSASPRASSRRGSSVTFSNDWRTTTTAGARRASRSSAARSVTSRRGASWKTRARKSTPSSTVPRRC